MSDITEHDPQNWLIEYGDYLYNYALSRVKNQALAEDLVQDTLLAGFKNLTKFEGRSSIKTWLTTILKNKIFDSYKKNFKTDSLDQLLQNNPESSEFNALGIWQVNVPNWGKDPASLLENQQLKLVFSECFKKLPEKFYKVMSATYLLEIDAEQICKELGISNSNYWVIMHRARSALRSCLEINWYKK